MTEKYTPEEFMERARVAYDACQPGGNLRVGGDILRLMEEQKRFSESTFGTVEVREAKASLEHLMREAKEAWEHPDDIEEHADILLLLLDSTWRNGWGVWELLEAARKKQLKNKKRNWDVVWLFEEPYQCISTDGRWYCKAFRNGIHNQSGYGNTLEQAFEDADRMAREFDSNHGVQHTVAWCVFPPVYDSFEDLYSVKATRGNDVVVGVGDTAEKATLDARTRAEAKNG